MDIPSKLTEKRKLLCVDEECEESETFKEMTSEAPKTQLEHEKRLRRVIANSNERRRMQSINAGFQCLRTLIPNADGEKLSKAAILQQTGDYIHDLEREKSRLLSQNTQLKQMIRDMGSSPGDSDAGCKLSPPPKRKKRDTESSDEGISMSYDDLSPEELKREMIEVRSQLERERRLRIMLEEERRQLESQLYPERLRQIVTDVQKTKLDPEPSKKLPVREEKPVVKPVKPAVIEDSPRIPTVKPAVPAAPLAAVATPLLNNSVSRRNLETIVEAIRHLEGDSMLRDVSCHSPLGSGGCLAKDSGCSRILHSDDSEKESSGSDQEDCKSDRSGSHSPLPRAEDLSTSTSAAALLNLRQERHPIVAPSVTVVGGVDHYPGGTTVQLLHPAVVAPSVAVSSIHRHHSFIPRPAVIVQKSS